MTPGQTRICTEQVRDQYDVVIVQEKLDGACVAVARVGDKLHAISRSGYLAQASPYEHLQLFAAWVRQHEDRFRAVLQPGERLVGEWLALAHGTKYDLRGFEPFAVFDLMLRQTRLPLRKLIDRLDANFDRPTLLSVGPPRSIEEVMTVHKIGHWHGESLEGVVYRVERNGVVDFLAKYVRPDKVDGKYLPEISGQPAVWNWRP